MTVWRWRTDDRPVTLLSPNRHVAFLSWRPSGFDRLQANRTAFTTRLESSQMMNKRTCLLACAALLALAGCASTTAPKTIAELAAAAPELSTLNGLIKQAGLTETLQGAGPFTVFAPTNDAFKMVPAKTMEALAKDPAALKDVLSFHVLPGAVLAADVKNGNLKTAQGANLALARAGTMVTVEDAVVEKADVRASNGVVHVIDRVLIPPKK
jgi:uncharacterized surface protein with fasciclin (FAS1) repeats